MKSPTHHLIDPGDIAASPAGSIQLSDVTRAYESAGEPFLAVRSVDLRIPAGQFVAVAGKSGSGKSTLLNLIAGIDRATAGAVCVGGVALASLSEDQLAVWRGRSVGVVFQFHQLMPALTVLLSERKDSMQPGIFLTGRRSRSSISLKKLWEKFGH